MVSASCSGDEKTVKILLDKKVDPNMTHDYGTEAPFWESVKNNHKNIVKIFLEAGVKPDLPDIDGFTPLAFAVKNNNLDIARLLLNYGASPILNIYLL